MKDMKDMKGSDGIDISTRMQVQQQVIEGAPGFEFGALISESWSFFNHLPLQLFMSFMLFMSFLFGF